VNAINRPRLATNPKQPVRKDSIPEAEEKAKLPGVPLYQYYFRALICFAASGTIATDMAWPKIDFISVAVIIFLLSYTFFTFVLIKKLKPADAGLFAERLSYGDAALMGVVLNLIDFALLPSILFVTMVQFNAYANGRVTM